MMQQTSIFLLGFLAQLLFSARQLCQWIASEKAGKVLSPILFWQLSIVASFLLIVYGWLRNDLVIIFGQVVTYGVYIRNLCYFGFWDKLPWLFRKFVLAFPICAIGYLLISNVYEFDILEENSDISTTLFLWGLAGQCIFSFRFVYQWIYSERRKQSVLPTGFWVISLMGSLMVLVYAVFRRDPVIFIGQLFGVVVYSRNLIIGYREAAISRS